MLLISKNAWLFLSDLSSYNIISQRFNVPKFENFPFRSNHGGSIYSVTKHTKSEIPSLM